jgi:2-hydroxy-4-(methylsulfanyl)butanoate S-methyltransferase
MIELAQATGIAENRLRTLLTALKSLGLISEHEGRFINAPATARYLVAGAPGDFRDYVRLVNGVLSYDSFRHLDAALQGERTFPDKGLYEGLVYESGIGGEQFSTAQHSGSLGPARLRAGRVNLSGRRRLLDVGGGSGAYSLAFCAAIRNFRRRSSIFRTRSAPRKNTRGTPGLPSGSRICLEMRSPRIGLVART